MTGAVAGGDVARLLPGAMALAQGTGAPPLMGFVYRGADRRHQVPEISDLGLIPSQPDRTQAAATDLLPPGRFLHDGSADSVPARG